MLLILAGVTLNMVVGQNGIFNKATSAKEETKQQIILEAWNLLNAESTLYEQTGKEGLKEEKIKGRLEEAGITFGENSYPTWEEFKNGSTITIKEKTIKYADLYTGESSITQTYTITYNLDGGTLESGNPESYNKETENFTLNNPTKAGYTFLGWIGSNVEGANTTVTIEKGTTGNLSYIATWKFAEPVALIGNGTHTATTLATDNWTILGKIAKAISNNTSITNNTEEVKVMVEGIEYTIGVGDTGTLNSKAIRVMGFNHDTLTNQNAYGTPTATGKAGITFEFAECLGTATMNGSDTSSGGWESSAMYGATMQTYYNQINSSSSEWGINVKAVKKDYIQTYNSPSSVKTLTSENAGDKLWLLSCSEIWNNGYVSGKYGYAIAKEGEQYKYYKKINATYNLTNASLVKENGTSDAWWLRSPDYNSIGAFCCVYRLC